MVEIHPRIREEYPALRGARRERKRKAFTLKARLVRCKVALDLCADRIEQDRLFDDLPREHLLDETRHEHRVEAEASRGADRANENPSVALHGRRDCGLKEQTSKDDEDLVQLDRTDGRHGRQLRADRGHTIRVLEGPRRKRPEPIEPLAPARLGRQAIELVDERERVRCKGGKIVQCSRERSCLRLVFPADLRELAAQLVREPVDPTAPAIAPSDHRGLHEQTLPTPRRPQLSVSNGRIGCGRRCVGSS